MASLTDQSNLTLDLNFQARILQAIVAAALTVQGEVQGAMGIEKYNKRQSLARTVLNAPSSQVSRFAAAVAANASVIGDYGAPVAISSSTAANPAVVTTAAVHGLTTGDCVVIAGHATNTALNGGWTVTVLTTTTFSIPVLGTAAGGATGTVRKHPTDIDINVTVTTSSFWDDMAGVTVLD
jgi:hypothetical protein